MNSAIGNNLPRIKVKNQYAIKEIVYKFGPISRIEIAERLGLTLPTITTSVVTMLKKGLLKEVGNNSDVKTLGRKTTLIDINEEYARFVGIEVRGTARRGVVTDAKGKTLFALSDDTPYTEYEDAISSASRLFFSLLEKGELEAEEIESVGLTTPGIVEPNEGKLLVHPGYKWKEKSMVEDFKEKTGYKGDVYIENNTTSRAYAMSMFEGKLLKKADSMAYMFISTGIGCPLISSIREHFGVVTGDGEVGHMVMDPKGPKCVCGNSGCLEAYSSEKAILEKALKKAQDGSSPVLRKVMDEKGTITISDVMEASGGGDREAKAIVEEAMEYLGLAIANIDNFVRPEYVVVEGKLFDEEENRKYLLDVIHRNLYRVTMSDYRFLFRRSDDFSGARGASAIAIRKDLELFVE